MKYAFIQENILVYSAVSLCRALQVSRSGYYSWRARKPSKRDVETAEIVKDIQCVHTETSSTYGSPRMYLELLDKGYRLSLGRVERLMQLFGLGAKQGRKNKRTQEHRNTTAPFENILDRQFQASQPDIKWVSDITFIETREGFLYLAVVLDLFSRAIVGWSMSHKIDEALVQGALNMAVERRSISPGLLLHSDQGSQYKATQYQKNIKELGIISSMSRKGECHDNAVVESFFHTLKTELICETVYSSRALARQEIFKYIEIFYNRKRRHSTISYNAPLEYEMINAA